MREGFRINMAVGGKDPGAYCADNDRKADASK